MLLMRYGVVKEEANLPSHVTHDTSSSVTLLCENQQSKVVANLLQVNREREASFQVTKTIIVMYSYKFYPLLFFFFTYLRVSYVMCGNLRHVIFSCLLLVECKLPQ